MTLLLDVDDGQHGRLVLEDGQRVALLGASGSGKTQLLRAVLGLGGQTGTVKVSGRALDRREFASTVGWVPEQGGVFGHLTVLDNVARPPHVRPIENDEALDALDLVALAARASEAVGSLSTNEQRRVSLARAIARRVPLLVIDGDLDATLGPMLPAVLNVLPHIRGVLTAGCTADDWAWRADTVVLVDGARVVRQAPLHQLLGSRDSAVRSVLTWVMPNVV